MQIPSFALLYCAIVFSNSLSKGSAESPWPHPDKLLGFWPLDAQYKIQDISPNKFDGDKAKSSYLLEVGPFGDAQTAVKPLATNFVTMAVPNTKLVLNSSFTISLFIARGNGAGEGGIFEFQDQYETTHAFQFRYMNETTFEVSAAGITIGQYTMIQQKQAWTYVAFVYDATTHMFSVYGKHGLVSPPVSKPEITSSFPFSNHGILLGYAARWDQKLRLTDAVSCLMIYSTALSAKEIRQAYGSCRIAHGSAPCGAPRISSPPIPPLPSDTIPKEGQFPYVGLISSTKKTNCSANIIDSFWVATSVACVDESTDISKCKVYVGVYDMAEKEEYTRVHACSKVITSGSEHRAIALVELKEPIDFTNEYVNDVCLVGFDDAPDIGQTTPQYIFGWGLHGRPAVISQTLPRCNIGHKGDYRQCMQAWDPSIYDEVKDVCYVSQTDYHDVPCTGDEGSPLLVEVKGDPEKGTSDHLIQSGQYYLRDSYCSEKKPGLFTNMILLNDWIVQKVACAIPGFYYPDSCPQN